VTPNETNDFRCTPLDHLILQTDFRPCTEEDFLKGIADTSIDLIDSGATFSEEVLCYTLSIRNPLKVIENIGRQNDHRIGTKKDYTGDVCWHAKRL
jgi:hypothetical protein